MMRTPTNAEALASALQDLPLSDVLLAFDMIPIARLQRIKDIATCVHFTRSALGIPDTAMRAMCADRLGADSSTT